MHRWILERCCLLLLSLVSAAWARPQYVAHMPSVKTGPYRITNCGTHTAEVSILVNTLLNTLQGVLDDVSQLQSSATYTTFFKSLAFAPTVRDILSNITTGAPIRPGPHMLRNAPPEFFGTPITPQFVCITQYSQISWSREAGGQGGAQVDAYTACTQSPVHAFSVVGSKYLENSIILCPSFWTYPSIPSVSKASCLTVDPNFNRFRESGRSIINYQMWVILQELAQSYIYARTGSLRHLFSANDCASLAPSHAVDNAMNYVYYAANIRLGCTNFPMYVLPNYHATARFRPGSVELLEINANTTLDGDSGSQNSSISEGQFVGNSSAGDAVAIAPWPS